MATREVVWTIAIAALTFGCGGDDPGAKVVGETAVVLDLVETGTRGRETPIGNLAADSVLEVTASHGATIAIVNGGSLRCPAEFDAVQCAGYAIQPGPITQADLDVVLTFKTQLVVKDISGATLRSTLERSVATIPSELKGWFLHVAGLSYAADCTNPAQQIDAEGTTLISEGSRITSVTIGGAPLDDTATYRIGLNAFVAAGNDGHVLLGQAPIAESLSENEQDAAIAFLGAHSPVSPAVEGRIDLTATCLP
jgi:2',3'-cyclic-nucleotide 2'-phosphodiesterase (5'-nucleotidase family)